MNPGVQTNMKINPLGLSFALAALLASTAAFGASAEEQAKTRRLKAAADHPADCVHPAGKPLLVSVGRLAEVKRYDMLIDICAELEKELDFELWIVGGGELEAELREKLRASGARCVKLLGARENPYPYIACADWLVSSSRNVAACSALNVWPRCTL